MDTNTATAPNAAAYRAVVQDFRVITETLDNYPDLPTEARDALRYRLEILEFQADKMAAEWRAANPAAQRAYSASLSRTRIA